MKKAFLLVYSVCVLFVLACSSDDVDKVTDAIENPDDVIEIIEGIERKAIDTSRMGINAFGNKAQFGSACAQFAEVRNTLRLNFIRVLVQWNDAVQPGANAPINFSFYDSLINCIPAGVDALVVVAGLPSWMSDSANWIEGNPRTTFVERWVRPVTTRYANNSRVIAWQIWNEPNRDVDRDNAVLDVLNSPANYVEMLARAYSVAKDIAPSKLVINAATTSLIQNFPDTLNYNQELKDSGIESFTDVYAIHYYGEQFEKFIPRGRDFLQSLSKAIWITESGKQGFNRQLAYVETVWPYLREQIPAIDRIYYYQFASETGADSAFGLLNTSAETPVSDLYLFLRDR